MIILTIRTNKPEAEVGLFRDDKEVGYQVWLADRKLTQTIHQQIQDLLNKSSISSGEVEGIVVFEGPGSFTGLRIGHAVANALANANSIPIIATGGLNWTDEGLAKLASGESDKIALPKYGSPPNITKPKK